MKGRWWKPAGWCTLGLAAAAWLAYGAISRFNREEAGYAAGQAVLSRTQDARRLVLVTLEDPRAERGRYPAELRSSSLDRPLSYGWFYRASADGSDYELWCSVPRQAGGFDALVFSPDGLIGADWPGVRSTVGPGWTLVEHAERAPPDRWQGPINP